MKTHSMLGASILKELPTYQRKHWSVWLMKSADGTMNVMMEKAIRMD